MNEELRKTTNEEKTVSIKNDILNDFFSDMVDKRLIWMIFSFFQDSILKF